MMPLSPAPNKNAIVANLFALDPWAKWFRDIAALLAFPNNHTRTPTPAFTGQAVVGTVDTALVYVKDRNVIQAQLTWTPSGGGTVEFTAGAYLSNLPYQPSHDAVGVLVNLTTLAVVGAVHAAAGTARLYLPTLAPTSAPLAATITYRTEDA